MISKNFKVLETKDNKEYVFDSIAFKCSVRKYSVENGTSMEKVKSYLAEETFTTESSITNWIYGRNGVSDLETVKVLAKSLEVDYLKLLKTKESSNMNMIEEKENNVITNVDMDKTKEVVRAIYQQMAEFMDAADYIIWFDFEPCDFYKYDFEFRKMKTALHKSMLDIPGKIYNQLNDIIENELSVYLYGYDMEHDIWDSKEYAEFVENNKANVHPDLLESKFMDARQTEFYSKMREILKDYITD